MSAPTTADVRDALAVLVAYRGTLPPGARVFADLHMRQMVEALTDIALPLAEERDAERARADAAEAEVGRLKARLASTEESIRLMENAAVRDDRSGGHGCGCGGY